MAQPKLLFLSLSSLPKTQLNKNDWALSNNKLKEQRNGTLKASVQLLEKLSAD
jgi:hypothetical protein